MEALFNSAVLEKFRIPHSTAPVVAPETSVAAPATSMAPVVAPETSVAPVGAPEAPAPTTVIGISTSAFEGKNSLTGTDLRTFYVGMHLNKFLNLGYWLKN